MIREALRNLRLNKGVNLRAVLTVASAVAVVIAVVGVSTSAFAHVDTRLRGPEVLVIAVEADSTEEAGLTVGMITAGAEDRVIRVLPTASAVGSVLDLGVHPVTPTLRLITETTPSAVPTRVFAISSGAFITEGIRVSPEAYREWRTPTPGIALIGWELASQLGVNVTSGSWGIRVGTTDLDVVGVIEGSSGLPDLTRSIIIPYSESAPWAQDHSATRISLLLPSAIYDQASLALPYILIPTAPESASVLVTGRPDEALRSAVSQDLRAAGYGLAATTLLISIATISMMIGTAVRQRRHEFGVRRALGASRKWIRNMVLLEASLLCGIGGLFGALLGLGSVLAWASWNGFEPTMHPLFLGFAPVLGLLVGCVAGALPARIAASMDPVEAVALG